MGNKLRAAIIGLGGISHLHVGGWEAAEDAELVAASDVNPDVFDSWTAQHGPIRTTTSAQELIEDPTIDIVDICTPNNVHAEIAIAAAKAGKHIICEKPLGPRR